MLKNKVIDTIKNLANDLDYFDRVIKTEADTLRADLSKKLESTPDPYQHLDVVTNHFIETFSMLSARVKLLEAVVKNPNSQEASRLSIGSNSPGHILKFVDEISITADRFCNQHNFYGEEKTESGTYYSWTGPSPVNSFELPITRNKAKYGQFGFISIIDEELLKTLTVKVNGEPVQFKTGSTKNQRIIEFRIPATKDRNVTVVSLNLANTICPLETGKGQDARHLGLALSAISVTHKSTI